MHNHKIPYLALSSLLIAMLLSIVYIPPGLKLYWPPLVAMLYFYWLIFKGFSSGLWWAWLLGFIVGCLLGEPLGLSGFLMLWFAFPLFYYQRAIQFFPILNTWLLWIVLTILYVLVKALLLALLGYALTPLLAMKPILGVLMFGALIPLCLSRCASCSKLKRGASH